MIEKSTAGLISSAFIVEMGLNHGLSHLRNNDYKLEKSKCRDGYLVHLRQPQKGISDSDVKELQTWLLTSKYRVAAVVFYNWGGYGQAPERLEPCILAKTEL